MEVLSDLTTFAEILTNKGYDGYFQTQAAYAGKLKESIEKYLENCRKGTDSLPRKDLLLTCYLQWSGEEKPSVICYMWVKYLDGKFSLRGMEIEKNNRFGQLLKKAELTNLTTETAPKAVDAIALVNDEQKQMAGQSPKRFKL